MLDRDDFFHLRRRQLARDVSDAAARDEHGDVAVHLLRCGNRFPRRAIELPVALFGNDDDHGITRTSSRSLRTSSFAASAGEPPMICVFFPFSGT